MYSPARENAIAKKDILAGWAKAGLFPLNLARVLRDIVKPVIALTFSKADEVKVELCAEYDRSTANARNAGVKRGSYVAAQYNQAGS